MKLFEKESGPAPCSEYLPVAVIRITVSCRSYLVKKRSLLYCTAFLKALYCLFTAVV
uniref:Uncharacterized protein n=1 Tax=Anguilla anguilla TaxID=7936 RepID=A0A0E9QS61_ANGAN